MNILSIKYCKNLRKMFFDKKIGKAYPLQFFQFVTEIENARYLAWECNYTCKIQWSYQNCNISEIYRITANWQTLVVTKTLITPSLDVQLQF